MATLTTSWKSYASASYSTGVATVTFYLEAKYSSQSVANNTTAVQTRLKYSITKGNEISGAGYKFTCTYCSTVSGSGTYTFKGTDKVITSGSATVTHNNDGTKTLSLSATAYNKYWNFTKNLSASVSLPKIDRYAVITSAQDFTDEGNPVLGYSNPAGNNVTSLQACIASPDAQTIYVPYRDISKTGTSYTFNLTTNERNTLRNAIPNSLYLPVKFYVKTVNGGTTFYQNSAEKKMTLVNGNPTFNATYQDTNSSTIAITGNNQKLIRNKSTLQINVTGAAAQKGASLSSIKCIINGVTYNTTLSGSTATFNIGTLNISSNTTAQVILTDSRGLQASRNLTLQMIDWQLPNAIINMQRENNFYSTTNITVDANYSSLNSQNTITIQMRYKKTTEGSYGSYTTLQDNVTSQFTFDNNYQWNIQVLLTDRLGSTTYNLVLDRGTPLIYFDRLNNSVGINTIPQFQDNLDVRATEIVDTIKTKNLFDSKTLVLGDITGAFPTLRISSRQALWLGAGTYTFSTNLSSTYRFDLQVQSVGVPPLSSYPTYVYDSGWQTTSPKTFTINSGGYFNILLSKTDNSAFSSTDITNLYGYNYQLEDGSVSTTITPYQNLTPNVSDTRWHTLTIQSNFAKYNNENYNIPRIRKIGCIVHLEGEVTPASSLNSSNEYVICNIPQGFRPSHLQRFICQGSGSNKWLLSVYTNGDVKFQRYGVSSFDTISSGVWLPFMVTYFVD